MLYATVYWCCPHSIRSRVYAVVSRLSESICVSHRSTAATAVGGFAAKRPVDRRYWWIPAGDLLQALALSSNCGQRLVESRRRRLNTDLLVMVSLQCCVAAMNGKARSRKTPNSFSLVFHSSLHFTLLSVPFWCLFLFIMHLEELFFFLFCLERGADLHMAQLMPVLLTVSCFSKIQIGFTFLVPASPRQRLLNVCVCF